MHEFAELARLHRGIENSCHGVLDAAFLEKGFMA